MTLTFLFFLLLLQSATCVEEKAKAQSEAINGPLEEAPVKDEAK